MLLRELTEKQEKFAAARARGKSWADAYREAYEPSNPNAPSIYTRAHRTRQNPLVAQRILELREQLKPAADVGAVYQQLLTAALKLAETATEDKTRLGALQCAGATLEKIRKLKEAAGRPAGEKKSAEDPAQLIAELRSLYARTLPRKAAVSVEEREAEEPFVESEEEQERKLEEPLAAGIGDVSASAAGLLEEIRRPMKEEVPEQPAPQVRYIEKCISKPGHFPPRFVKVAVQTPSSPDVT